VRPVAPLTRAVIGADYSGLFKAIQKSPRPILDLFQLKPTHQQEELVDFVEMEHHYAPRHRKKRAAIRSGQGTGKCQRAGKEFAPRIFDPHTGSMSLATPDLPAKVTACDHSNGDRMVSAAATPVPQPNKKETYRLENALGDVIHPSFDHPIFTPRGYVHAEDLKEGDYIATCRKLPPPSISVDPKLSDDEVVFLAGMVADGGLTQSCVRWTHLPGPFFDEFEQTIARLGHTYSRFEEGSRADTLRVGVTCKPLLQEAGLLGALSKGRRLPPQIFKLQDRQLALFLNAFWSCDGYYGKQGPECGLASEGLIDDLRVVLQRFDIVARKRHKKAKCQTGEFDAWVLTVSGPHVKTWMERIGLSKGREFPESWHVRSNPNADAFPVDRELFEQLLEHFELTAAEARTRFGLRYRPSAAAVSRMKVEEVAEALGKELPFWTDIAWSKIVSLESEGLNDVFDLTVPPYGNFVSNNCVVHNTTLMVALSGFWRPLRGRDGQTLVTAPTGRQCRDVYLGEARRLLAAAPKWFQRMVDIKHDRMDFAGRKTWGVITATSANDRNMQGFHNHLLSVYLEEMSGLSDEMVEQCQGTLSNADSYLFAAGNPNLRACKMYKVFYGPEADEWELFHWNAEESPIADKRNQEKLAREYGRESDVYRVRVLGEFPRGNPEAIIDADALMECIGHDRPEMGMYRPMDGQRTHWQFGIDLARFGGDESVICLRRGQSVYALRTFMHAEPADVIDFAMEMQGELDIPDIDCTYVIDSGGLGGGALRDIHRARKRVHEFHNGGKSSSRDFDNKITEAWFWLRMLVKERAIFLPVDNKLHDQLIGRVYKLTDTEAKMRVRSKDEHRTLGLESPDRAEAVAYAFFPKVTCKPLVSKNNSPRRAKPTRSLGASLRLAR